MTIPWREQFPMQTMIVTPLYNAYNDRYTRIKVHKYSVHTITITTIHDKEPIAQYVTHRPSTFQTSIPVGHHNRMTIRKEKNRKNANGRTKPSCVAYLEKNELKASCTSSPFNPLSFIQDFSKSLTYLPALYPVLSPPYASI